MRICWISIAISMIGSCLAFAGRGAAIHRSPAFAHGALRRYHCLPQLPRSQTTRYSAEGNDTNVIESTWTYVPFQEAPTTQLQRHQQRRSFSSGWIVPKHIDIPEDRIDISFTRSSGAGGQNVNKVNTKVELRFHVMEATWLPLEVRERLQEQQANRINKEGFLNLQSQDYRTQAQNRKAAFSKLREMIMQAYPRPKQRKLRTGLSKGAKERRKEDKRKRSQIKANRRQVNF